MNLPDILYKLAKREATTQEKDAFSAHLTTLNREEYEKLVDTYGEIIKMTAVAGEPDRELFAIIKQHIAIQAPEVKVPGVLQALTIAFKNKRSVYYSIAAIFIAVFISAYFFMTQKAEKPLLAQNAIAIPPGKNKAVLTLANGQQIVLDDAKQGDVASQDGVKIIKIDSGIVAYHANAATGNEIAYNTITTPRGGQYSLILPDGTQAWLNAASSLRFPTVFNGNERRVELTGEGYFSVTHDAAHPFIVSFNNTQVRVLGTEFNIMAYGDEPAMQTTLVKGSIRLSNNNQETLLQPGKMAMITTEAATPTQVQDADVEQVTAWKNGQISLTNADLPTVMRQVSRWYDVNIHYKGTIPDKHFFGLINRNVNLSTILHFLQDNQVHVTQEGRDIIISP